MNENRNETGDKQKEGGGARKEMKQGMRQERNQLMKGTGKK